MFESPSCFGQAAQLDLARGGVMELMDPHAADPKPARGEEGEPTPFQFGELDLRLFWIRCTVGRHTSRAQRRLSYRSQSNAAG